MKFFIAAVLALAVVDAGVVVHHKGGNFVYTVNSLPYVQHVLPYYPAPLQLVNPVAAEVKAVKAQTVLPFVNPFYPSLAPYSLINPVGVKTDIDTDTDIDPYENIETVTVPLHFSSPFHHPTSYAYSALPFSFASSIVQAGYEPFPQAVEEQVKEAAGGVDSVEPDDAVIVQIE